MSCAWAGGSCAGEDAAAAGATRHLRHHPRRLGTADLQSAACLARVVAGVVAGGGAQAAAAPLADATQRSRECCCPHEAAAGLAPVGNAAAASGSHDLAAEATLRDARREGLGPDPPARSPRPHGGAMDLACRPKLLPRSKQPGGPVGETQPSAPSPSSHCHRPRHLFGDAEPCCSQGY